MCTNGVRSDSIYLKIICIMTGFESIVSVAAKSQIILNNKPSESNQQ